jgi:DNA replication protein DnaC
MTAKKRPTKAQRAVLAIQEKALSAAAHCPECGSPTRTIADGTAAFAFCPVCHARRLRDQAVRRQEAKVERDQVVKPMPQKPLVEQTTCPDCGGAKKIIRILSSVIGICETCRAQALRAEKAAEEAQRAASVNDALVYAGIPAKYHGYSLLDITKLHDWRGRPIPPRENWPVGVVMITTQSEYDFIKRLRHLQYNQLRFWGLVDGPPGQGKTLLLAAWLCDQIRLGLRGALWLSEREFANLSAAQFGTVQKQRADELLDRAGRSRLLVWDDLGFTGNGKLFANVLGLRYERELPTLISTNLTASQRVRLLDAPTASRLHELTRAGFLVTLEGPDKRSAV